MNRTSDINSLDRSGRTGFISFSQPVASRLIRLGASLALLIAVVAARAEVNVLANPQWDPTTTNGTDGARNWSYSARAGQLNDLWSVGHPASTDGRYGFLKIQTYGTNANDFQVATSPWYSVQPGNTWNASAWFRPEGSNLVGDQVGLLKVEIADASLATVTNFTQVVVTSLSNDVYTLGKLAVIIPTNGAYIRMQPGLLSPSDTNGAGYVLVDDAALSSPNEVLPNPGWDPTVANAANTGRDWAYTFTSTSERAYARNDDSGAGRNPVSNKALGYLKAQLDGTIPGDFQRATSPWFIAAPGNPWVASVFGRSEGGTSLKGTQTGIVVLQYADASGSNILATVTNTVVTTNSGSAWKLAGVTAAAPASAALVRMLVGTQQPTTNAAGHALFDDASLTTTAQMLANPGWDPTRVGGNDTGRNWTRTDLAEAQIINDVSFAARAGSGNGARGFLKAIVDGSIAPDFQGALSDWCAASAGQEYQAGVFARPEGLNLHGSQQGVLVLEFADSATNVLATFTNTVVTSTNTDAYHLGLLSAVAPASTAYVRMQAGLYAPTFDGSGYLLFDDASLLPVTTAAPEPPALSMAWAGPGSLVISWTGTGTLHESTNLAAGVWTPVAGSPVSPYTNTPSGPQKFFQIR